MFTHDFAQPALYPFSKMITEQPAPNPAPSSDEGKGLLRSSTVDCAIALAVFSLADSTQPLWFPFVSQWVPENAGYLDGGTAINVALKLAGHALPVALLLYGIIRGRVKAGGIKGLV